MFILPIKSRLEILEERKKPEFFFKTNYIVLMYMPTPQKSINFNLKVNNFIRFLPVVSKKISKKAVIRNKIRRRLKEAFKSIDKSLFKNQYDYQIIARHNILNISMQEIAEDIKKCLNNQK